MNTHDIDLPKPSVVSVCDNHTRWITVKNQDYFTREQVIDAIEADRKRRGEPVGYLVELDGRDTYVSADRTVRDAHLTYGWRPVYAAPQPAEPVKVPSDDEILAWAGEEQFFLFADPEEVLDIVKSALQHFGQPKPSNSGELEPAASAQPVVNQQMTTAASDVLADTQRAIIEAAERRGYERGLAECAQDREDAQRLDWLDAQNARFRVGWHVGRAPAGNVRINSVIVTGRSKLTSIREAIDAARAAKERT